MDTNTRQHHTRSKAQSQELAPLADTERKIETHTIDTSDVAIKKTNKEEIGSSEEEEDTQQPNEMMLLLRQVLLKQDQLLGENKKLKDEMATQQTTIKNLSLAVENLQATKHDSTPNDQQPTKINDEQQMQLSTALISQATKQLQAKRMAKLLEIAPFTGLPHEDVDDWLTEFDKRCEDVQLENAQRLSVARDLLKGTVKLWNDTYEKTINDWHTFKTKMIAHFMLVSGIDQFTLGQQLYNRQQHPNEDGMSYFHNVVRLCSKVNPDMDEATRVKHLLKGLSAETKIYMELTKPQNADDLLQSLVKFEQLLAEKVKKQVKSATNRLPVQQPPIVNEGGHHPSLITIAAIVNGSPIHAMIDTGATVSLIAQSELNHITHSPVQPTTTTATLGDGQTKIMVNGTVELCVAINDISTFITALVVDSLGAKLILGMDWCQSNNVNVQIGQRQVEINHQQQGTTTTPFLEDGSVDVRLDECVALLPHHEHIIKVHTPISSAKLVSFTPDKKTML